MISSVIQVPERFGSAQARMTCSKARSELKVKCFIDLRRLFVTRRSPGSRTPRRRGAHHPIRPLPPTPTPMGNRPARYERRTWVCVAVYDTARRSSRSIRSAPSVDRSRSVERVAAGAGTAGVRVVNGEALLLDRVGEVDDRIAEIGNAHPVDDDLDAVELADGITVEVALIEVELVDQAGAAAGLDGHTQAQIVATFLFEQAPDLVGSGRGELDLVSGLRIFSHSHGYSFSRSCPQATPG